MSKIMLIILSLIAALPVAASMPDSAGTIPVENVNFEMSGGEVLIRYDLKAPTDETYHVALVLKRESDPSFEYSPVGVSGDVGSGVFAGTQRRIQWVLAEEFPQGLKGEDYY